MANNDPASQYTLLEKLGTGSFGTVYKGCVAINLMALVQLQSVLFR